MPISVTVSAHGAASFDALAAAVRRAQGGDPLAPVTVIVPTNTAGVMARRALGRRGGAANVDVLTLFRVAELLGARTLVDADRAPVSTPVVDVAVRHVLTVAPGRFAAVAEHPSTVVALRDLYREVRLAGAGALAALSATGRGAEPARIVAAVARLLEPHWYDEGDLLAAAVAAAARRPELLRRVVVHGPERLRPLELELMRALGAAGDVELVVARTGDDHADAPVLDAVAALTHAELPVLAASVPVGAVRVISTTDADEEVRAAVRVVVDAARRGAHFDRVAVLWPSDRPYARLVEHHLSAAGAPWNGRPGTTVIERMVPRVLVELLDLDRRGLRRVPLMTLLGDVPASGADGRLVPVARWERIAREAGIVRDADWTSHLPRAIDELRRRDPEEWPNLGDRIAAAEALGGFVAGLRQALGDRDRTRPWSEWKAWCHERLVHWFGPRLERLGGAEHVALEQTQRVLDRLAHLDRLGGRDGQRVTRAEVRATFVAELEAVPARRGTIGDGVHVGSLAGARGLDLDLVVVVGAADGLLPPPPLIDPLLGDDERGAAGLTTSDERARNARRQFLAVTSTTPAVAVTVPRGDLRATSTNHPSRWLAPLLDGGAAVADILDSHAHALASAEFPTSPGEHRRRQLWVHARSGADVREHERIVGDEVARRALSLKDARASAAFTEFDGDLGARRISLFDRPVSPSRLEAWAKCPHAFFVRHVLGVRPVEEPSELTTVDARDRGLAIHAALDALQRQVLDGVVDHPGPDGWDDSHADRLAEIAVRMADDLELGGRTGRAAYWATARDELLAEVAEWVERERANWQGRRLRYSEQRFGDELEVAVALPDGRRLAVRGSIDRVDELPDGSLLVTDHKTGKSDDFKKLASDPTLGGTHFQLPVYAAAARALVGDPAIPVRAEYAFFRRGDYQRYRVELDDAALAESAVALATVVDGIEAGVFLSRPEPPGWRLFVACPFCEPDGLGTAERFAEWDRKRHDPRLARWFAEPSTDSGIDQAGDQR